MVNSNETAHDAQSTKTSRIEIKTDAEILAGDFENAKFIVENLIPFGLSLLAGAPKSGKSIFALNLAVDITNAAKVLGNYDTASCEILYLTLEDNWNRIKNRLSKVTDQESTKNKIHFATNLKKGSQPSIELLSDILKANPNIKLIIIDTYFKFRTTEAKIKTGYNADYEYACEIKKMADNHQIAVILVHHTTKSKNKDWLNNLHGSNGLTGAADTIMYLEKERGCENAVLHATGRDIEDLSLPIKLDKQNLRWVQDDEESLPKMTPEQREIYEKLESAGQPMQLNKIAEAIGKSKTNTQKLLSKLVTAGLVIQPKNGFYAVAGKEGNNGIKEVEVVEMVEVVETLIAVKTIDFLEIRECALMWS